MLGKKTVAILIIKNLSLQDILLRSLFFVKKIFRFNSIKSVISIISLYSKKYVKIELKIFSIKKTFYFQ